MPLLRRLVAMWGIALVLLLVAASASAGLHEALHVGSAHEGGDQCAVVLFASGITLIAGAVAVTALRAIRYETAPAFIREIWVVHPRYLRQPERGPPVC